MFNNVFNKYSNITLYRLSIKKEKNNLKQMLDEGEDILSEKEHQRQNHDCILPD